MIHETEAYEQAPGWWRVHCLTCDWFGPLRPDSWDVRIDALHHEDEQR